MTTTINLINDNEIQSLLDSAETYFFYACRNSNTGTNQDLRRHGNAVTNQVPYLVPYDSTIEYLVAKHNDSGDNWDAKILVNGVEQFSFNVNNSVNTDPKSTTLSLAVNKDDLIRLRLENASATVNRPQIAILGRKT